MTTTNLLPSNGTSSGVPPPTQPVDSNAIDTLATSIKSTRDSHSQLRAGKRSTSTTNATNVSNDEKSCQLKIPSTTTTTISKHQPKKKKNGHHSSILRRTFSMTDEEFEDYIEDHENRPKLATVAKSKSSKTEIFEKEDNDSVVETTTSEDDEEEEEYEPNHVLYSDHNRHSCSKCAAEHDAKYQFDDVDNTSDLTSSPPPPISSPSCCSSSSSSSSPSSSSLNPLETLVTTSSSLQSSQPSPNESSSLDTLIDTFDKLQSSQSSPLPPPPPPIPKSSNHTESSLDTSNQFNKCHLLSPPTAASGLGCCPLCCSDPKVRISEIDTTSTGSTEPNTTTSHYHCGQPCSKSHLLPTYPPTVSSIRDAGSHLTRLDDFNVVKLSHGFFSQVFKVSNLIQN